MSSVSVENYLKAIFALEQRLESDDDRVKSKDIAESLSIAQPSVTSMLKTLSGQDMLDYKPYRGVRMTEEGRRAALRVIRRHRLIEVFLIESLGMGWDEVHAEAERLEHALSEKVTNALEEYLGFPTRDPHGDPIPDRDGRLIVTAGEPLNMIEPGRTATIVRVLDQSPDFLRYLAQQDLTPGAHITVEGIEPFDGPLTLRTGAREIHISRSVARRIVVRPEDDAADEDRDSSTA